MVKHYANVEEFISIYLSICTWVCFIKRMGKGGLFYVYTFLLSFFSGVGVGRGKVRRHQGFVCYFVLVLMQLVSTKVE